jgi:hypothetical protein
MISTTEIEMTCYGIAAEGQVWYYNKELNTVLDIASIHHDPIKQTYCAVSPQSTLVVSTTTFKNVVLNKTLTITNPNSTKIILGLISSTSGWSIAESSIHPGDPDHPVIYESDNTD